MLQFQELNRESKIELQQALVAPQGDAGSSWVMVVRGQQQVLDGHLGVLVMSGSGM